MKQKTNWMKLLAITLGIIVFLLIWSIHDNKIIEENYQKGYIDGSIERVNELNEGIIQRIRYDGYITINYPVGNKTMPIRLYPMMEEK